MCTPHTTSAVSKAIKHPLKWSCSCMLALHFCAIVAPLSHTLLGFRRGLFIESGDRVLFPNPDLYAAGDSADAVMEQLRHYEFLGQLTAKAVYEQNLVSLSASSWHVHISAIHTSASPQHFAQLFSCPFCCSEDRLPSPQLIGPWEAMILDCRHALNP